jgi:hypothetical protein
LRAWLVLCAGIFHHSVPVLSQSVRDKSRLRSIFFVAFMITSAFYVAIGIVISLYFGERVRATAGSPSYHRRSPALVAVVCCCAGGLTVQLELEGVRRVCVKGPPPAHARVRLGAVRAHRRAHLPRAGRHVR